jgi:hypothetical protein
MIVQIKKMAKYIPGVARLMFYVDKKYRRFLLNRKRSEDIFNEIYMNNLWGDNSSVSGPGSNMLETVVIREALPAMIKQYKISSILDIPCGDYYWMKDVDLTGVEYIGADLIQGIVHKNEAYSDVRRSFVQLDVIESALPKVDLVFVRDCFVHLSLSDVSKALINIVGSNSKYLLTTTFPDKRKNNKILTGEWSPINLEEYPFNLPKPIFLLNEGHPSKEYSDKSLGLWCVEDIKRALSI